MVRDDIDIISSTKILIQTDKDVVLQVNFMDNEKKIREKLN